MNSIDKIEKIYSQLSASNSILSLILPQLYPIALECKDYKGFYIMFLWGITVSNDSENNLSFHFKEACEMLRETGLEKEKIITIEKEAKNEYLILRGYDRKKKEMFLLSAKQMEDQLLQVNNAIDSITTSINSNQTNLVQRKAELDIKNEFLKLRKQAQDQYNILHEYVMNKLAKYQRIISSYSCEKNIVGNINNTKQIFIIHGHNEAKRRELESLIKDKFNLIPIVLSEQPSTGLTIIEKFEKYARDCCYAFAIFTPDDIVTNSNGDKYFQARPNVIFELGWFYARLGRSRVCIIEQESENSVIFSDLQGVMRVQFKTQVEERYLDIEKELKSVGII